MINPVRNNHDCDTDEIKQFLIAQGVRGLKRMAGYIPNKTSASITMLNVKKRSGYWIVEGNLFDIDDTSHELRLFDETEIPF